MKIYRVLSLIPGKEEGTQIRMVALYTAEHIRDVVSELYTDLQDESIEIESIECYGPLLRQLEDSQAWKQLFNESKDEPGSEAKA